MQSQESRLRGSGLSAGEKQPDWGASLWQLCQFTSWAKASTCTQPGPALSSAASVFPPPSVGSEACHPSPTLAHWEDLPLCDPT